MVLTGLFGMRFNERYLSFVPFLPEELNSIELKDIAYRNSKLDISIKGKGSTIKSFKLDGKEQPDYSIPSTIKGKHNIFIVLE